MAVRLPDDTVEARLQATLDLIDAGTGAGLLRIYSGTQPASANSAASGDLLAEFTLDDPAFTSNEDGTATLEDVPLSTTGESAAGAGTAAAWGRIVDSDENTVIDVSVGTSGSGAQIILNTATISEGVDVEITSGTLTEPNGE